VLDQIGTAARRNAPAGPQRDLVPCDGYDAGDDLTKSIAEALRVIRLRVKHGGAWWRHGGQAT
jgi:hypothetical protein